MFFTFQPSRIWDGAGRVDPSADTVRVKAKSEVRARKKLPTLSVGRHWILVKTEPKKS